jgi:protein tyrosine phosphatase (PTP) superfamily phosphohydrolase (DUF442 family)
MTQIIHIINKGIEVGQRRLSEQGLSTTLLWLYARGLPAVTGIPILKYSQVTPQLFVGPQYKANGLRYLQRNGIHAVVNMRIEHDDAIRGLAPEQYCYLPTIDDDAPSIEDLDSGVVFIDQVINSGGKVYIHCGAGVGRAPTMAAAYLISKGDTLEGALNTIRKARPFIYLMPPQMKRLQEYTVIHTLR